MKIFILIALIFASLTSYAEKNHPIMDQLIAGRNYTLMNSGLSCPSRQTIALSPTNYDGFGPRLSIDFGTIMIPMIPVALFNKGEWAIYKTGDVTGNRQLATLEIQEDDNQLAVTARAYKGWFFRKLQTSRSYIIKLTPMGFNMAGPDDTCEYAK